MESLHTELIPDIQEPQGQPKAKFRRALLEALETILLSVILFLAINLISERIRVESISMEPNLTPGNFVIVNKMAYRFSGSPKLGDIVVFRYPLNPDQIPYIKRVIGTPGDTIQIESGKVYVNNVQLNEPYIKEVTGRGGNWTVPANSIFVMGDNRNNSSDSRAWGFVPLENIIGRAELIYWPPEDWAVLHTKIAAAAPQQ